MKKIYFFTASHKFYLKFKDITNHWVGHLEMKPIDVKKLSDRKFVINKLKSGLKNDAET